MFSEMDGFDMDVYHTQESKLKISCTVQSLDVLGIDEQP